MTKLGKKIAEAEKFLAPPELALGYVRYEKLRTLNIRQFTELTKRNLNGENFDGMIDKMIANDELG